MIATICLSMILPACRMPGGEVASAPDSGHIINNIASKYQRQLADAVARSWHLTYFQTGRSRLAGMKRN